MDQGFQAASRMVWDRSQGSRRKLGTRESFGLLFQFRYHKIFVPEHDIASDEIAEFAKVPWPVILLAGIDEGF